MTVLQDAIVAVYGYDIVLSWWAMRVQRKAARMRHNPYGHSAANHVSERSAHFAIANVLIFSLAVRLAQLHHALTLWLMVPLTVLAVLMTVGVLYTVLWLGTGDLLRPYIGRINKLKTAVLLLCSVAILADQVWRLVSLF